MSNEKEQIKILLVDDHEVLRSGLRYIIDVIDTLEIVGEASNGIEAINLFKELKPDIVLMDLMMPEMDGIEATRAIKQQNQNSKVIILSSSIEDTMVQRALEAGAVSYLTKNISADDLTQAVTKAFLGISVLTPEATHALIQAKTRPDSPKFELTARELEVLEKLVAGMTNPQIADNLFISQATVKRHVSNIISKMNVSNRTEAVALAITYNLISNAHTH